MRAKISKSIFGRTPEGRIVDQYTLTNKNGMQASIITFGATLTALHTIDNKGEFDDIVLGFDDLNGYLENKPYFGCTVGRVANRIAKGKFTLEGKTYQLAINNGENSLHGGIKGFGKVVWQAKADEFQNSQAITLTYESKDGEEGFPGTLHTKLIYTLTNSNELRLEYTAVCDKTTPINLTNHSYFNLAGSQNRTILQHELWLNANRFTPADENLIPTGKYETVLGTLLDFTSPHSIGERINLMKTEPIGYDHSYELNQNKLSILAARVYEPMSGRIMEIYTSEPSIQLYTSNFLNSSVVGKGGIPCLQHQGLCLETQHFPDSVNQLQFPSILLKPGAIYKHTTTHQFSV